MDVNQEEIFEIKQEELIIKDEYISDPDPGSTSALTFPATTENFTDMRSESQDYSYQSETTSTITNMGNLKCRINCQQEYKTSRKYCLTRHMLTHSGEKPHHCKQCDYKSFHRGNLRKHMLTHSNEKPLEKPDHCKQCDFKTSQRGSLKRHILTHSDEKSHHCKQCDFKTSHKRGLKRHIVTHNDYEKRHRCEQCGFKTSRESCLNKHMLTHGCEKPHQCEQCDFKTAFKHSLKRHLLTHSGENSNHSGVTHSLLPTDSFNEDTKDSKKFILDLEIVPEECVVFNSIDLFIKEEPNDSDL